ncbi:MAG: hypothetical protein AAF962_09480 [Actinomycetota bacterium]
MDPLDATALARHRSELFLAVEKAMVDVRALTADTAPERARARAVRDRLLVLAADPAVAAAAGRAGAPSAEVDPQAAVEHIEAVLGMAPEAGRRIRSRFLRLAQDDDDRHALYLHVGRGRAASPIHHHGTWAVVIGVAGMEHNRFWRRDGDDAVPTGELAVGPGVGVAMTADDLHSVELDGPALHLHCYGLALERLDDRDFFDARAGAWRPFTNRVPISEARPGFG